MSEPLISADEWATWLGLPATKALRQVAAARRESLRSSWELGSFTEDLGLNAKAIGECQAYLILEQMDYETIILGELTDEPASTAGARPGGDGG